MVWLTVPPTLMATSSPLSGMPVGDQLAGSDQLAEATLPGTIQVRVVALAGVASEAPRRNVKEEMTECGAESPKAGHGRDFKVRGMADLGKRSSGKGYSEFGKRQMGSEVIGA
jgi:hypothetical protein